MSEPYDSIDALLKAMGPKCRRLLLREMLAFATRQGSISLVDAIKINNVLLGQRNRGEI